MFGRGPNSPVVNFNQNDTGRESLRTTVYCFVSCITFTLLSIIFVLMVISGIPLGSKYKARDLSAAQVSHVVLFILKPNLPILR